MLRLNDQEISVWLRDAWQEALSSDLSEEDSDYDIIHQSGLVSIRYALVTQLLGKFADPSRDALCLQRGKVEGAKEKGRWDPRSFCSAVVVPWVQDADGVLGTSSDPYVGKPLRRTRLDDWNTPLRQKAEWEHLVGLLESVQSANNSSATESALRRCLRSVARRYRELQVTFPVPQRVSLEQTIDITDRFLSERSGGERPLIVADALMRTVGRAFGLFDEVLRQGINEADAASNAAGDIMCLRNDDDVSFERQVMVVEVKDRNLTLIEVNASIEKVRASRVPVLLFIAPGLATSDEQAIRQRVNDEWTLDTNVYFSQLHEIMRVVFTLAGERTRIEFLQEIGIGINKLAVQPTLRLIWSNLLNQMGTARRS